MNTNIMRGCFRDFGNCTCPFIRNHYISAYKPAMPYSLTDGKFKRKKVRQRRRFTNVELNDDA
jgi:hypothetical protein